MLLHCGPCARGRRHGMGRISRVNIAAARILFCPHTVRRRYTARCFTTIRSLPSGRYVGRDRSGPRWWRIRPSRWPNRRGNRSGPRRRACGHNGLSARYVRRSGKYARRDRNSPRRQICQAQREVRQKRQEQPQMAWNKAEPLA